MQAQDNGGAKALVRDRIVAGRSAFQDLAGDLLRHPELGFRETQTAGIVAERLRNLGLEVEQGLAVTGVKARLRGGAKPAAGPRRTVAIIGELDALPLPGHPAADPTTGAAHACGHHAQLVHLLAAATALVETGAAANLAGDVVFLAVPAEELVDLDWRADLVRQGAVEFPAGKPELIRIGAFDDIDMAMLAHAKSAGGTPLSLAWRATGFISKRARFTGRAAHAAMAPERGINALNAATLAIGAIHAQRETFRDEDQIRVQPILTDGGRVANIVPAEARLETYVRGATLAAILDAERKVDRSIASGAMAVGASVEIATTHGYLPLEMDRGLGELFRRNAQALVGTEGWTEVASIAASTDLGDLGHLMPVLQASHGGWAGTNHAADFVVADPIAAFESPAIALAWTVIDLLADGATTAHAIATAFRPKFDREGYLAQVRGIARTDRYVYEQ